MALYPRLMPTVAPARRTLRTLAASVAALLAVSGGAALAHGSGERPVRGHKAHGTVTAIEAPSFTLTRGDTARQVTTTDATRFAKTVDAAVADAVPGSFVGAHGPVTDDGVAARLLRLRPAPENGPAASSTSNGRRGHVRGTVVTNDGSTLVVRTTGGDTRTVTTGDRTRVVRTFETDFAELAVDDRVRVLAQQGDGGTVTARGVHILATTEPDSSRANPKPAADSGSGDVPVAPVVLPDGAGAAVGAATRPLRPGAADQRPDHRPDRRHHAVAGIVERVAAPDFTLNDGRRTVTVATTDETRFAKTVDAAFADAAVGRTVSAMGERTGEMSMRAAGVHIHPERAGAEGSGPAPGHRPGHGRPPAGITGVVTAADPTTGVLTVSTPRGEVAVSTDGNTRFAETMPASFADVVTGGRAMAHGEASDGGSLAAASVHLDLTSGPRPAPPAKDRR